jgi:pimeloyl-ACP methyl ester carboxylesterase
LQTTHEHAEFFKNRKNNKLFGILHRPKQQADPNLGIVFCHPVSWEKQYSYRAYSQFSRYLGNAGYTSVRFDAYGFGDSDGDLVEATIQSQIEDTLDAIEWFRKSTGCTRYILVGVRLGAAIAALVAREASNVEGLAMVSPVVNGESYWKEWLRITRLGRMTLGQTMFKTKDLIAQLEREGAIEIDGELVSQKLVGELRNIDLANQLADFNGSCFLSELTWGGSDRQHFDALVGVLNERGTPVSAEFKEQKEFWVLKSRYEGYLPHDLYRRTAAWLKELPQ